MSIKDCIDFANEVKLCFLATAVGDQPRVRALSFWHADETGFYLQTGNKREFYQQLVKNPKTEICFYVNNSDKRTGTMLRISGKVNFLNDLKLKEKVVRDRPFLRQFGLTAENPDLVIFRIEHGEAHFWTSETNLKPKEIIKF